MNIVLINQYYVPDPAPTGQYLHSLARCMVERGHRVKVLCSSKAYSGGATYPAHETRDGVEIRRLAATGFGRAGFLGKVSDYHSFYLRLAIALLAERSRPDLIVALTTPPFVGLLGKLAAKRHRCADAHWIMDLYPDVMSAHGMSRQNSLLYRFLERLTRLQLKGSPCIITLGPTMLTKVGCYLDSSQPLSCARSIPLWTNPEHLPADAAAANRLRAERGWEPDELVLLYSGNMGLGHRFSEFLEAARTLGPTGPRWVFAGNGKRKAEVESFARAHPEARIEFLDYVPQELLREHLCSADVHLGSLDSAWEGLIVPSKIQGSFSVGRPVLFVGGRNNESAQWIRESGGGWAVAENDIEGLIEAIRSATDPEERRKRGAAARAFAQANFDMTTNCNQLAELLESAATVAQASSPAGSRSVPAAWSGNPKSKSESQIA